jgi:NTE family protein
VKALVLSAGGMFGAWQAGVWQALEGAFEPDLVIGASIGSINGWIIASGAPVSELVSLWLSPPLETRPKWRLPRRPWQGLADPAPLETAIRGIHQAYRPQIRYGLVLTRVPRLQPRLFTTDREVTWRHLMASCSVPVIFPACRLADDGRYVDGGFLGALPLWAALEEGATEIVAVDVMAHLSPGYRAMMGVLRRVAGRQVRVPETAAVNVMQPVRALGGVEDAMIWKRENIERWIADGRAAGERFRAGGGDFSFRVASGSGR